MAGTWQPLAHQPSFNTSTMILLTDGRVMVQEEATAHWHALSPDDSGSYVAGTWSTLADMSFWRRYYASGVLRDGRVFLAGGEQSGDTTTVGDNDSKKGEIYDPVKDAWTPIPDPPLPEIGDAACCVLPDGRVLVGGLRTTACALYDPVANSWSSAGDTAVRSNEETWVLQRDGTVLTVQCFSPFKGEKYVVASNSWKTEGTPPVTLVDPVMSEIGPAMLLPGGKTIFFGAANSGGRGKTALYSPPATPTGTGTWAAGPDIPQVSGKTIVSNDCPAALLPNGKVLFTGAEFQDNAWGRPVLFFEYDPGSNTIVPAPAPTNNDALLYRSRLMLLPSGEVLFSPSSNDVQIYTPDGGPQESWRPTIASVDPQLGPLPWVIDSYMVVGTQLNGLSQANIYGDDCYPATNYPLVRLRDLGSGAITYARTHDFSTMGVATGPVLQSCRFDPPNVADGTYELTVVANGIGSHGVVFRHQRRHKPEVLEGAAKPVFELVGKEIAESFVDHRQWAVDPEIAELRHQVKNLQNSVQRLTTIIAARELPQVGTQIAERAETDRVEGMTRNGDADVATDGGAGETSVPRTAE